MLCGSGRLLVCVASIDHSIKSIERTTYQIAAVKVQYCRLRPRRPRVDDVHVELEGLALDVFVRVCLGDVLRRHGFCRTTGLCRGSGASVYMD